MNSNNNSNISLQICFVLKHLLFKTHYCKRIQNIPQGNNNNILHCFPFINRNKNSPPAIQSNSKNFTYITILFCRNKISFPKLPRFHLHLTDGEYSLCSSQNYKKNVSTKILIHAILWRGWMMGQTRKSVIKVTYRKRQQSYV